MSIYKSHSDYYPHTIRLARVAAVVHQAQQVLIVCPILVGVLHQGESIFVGSVYVFICVRPKNVHGMAQN